MKNGALLSMIAVSMLVSSLASRARADVAPPPPEELECLPGAIGALATVPSDAHDERGRPARPWPYCRPTTCASDADCSHGRVCSTEEIGLCVRDRVDFGVTSREAIERGCEPNGTCLNLQSTCERARRCVPAPALAPEPPPTTAAPTTTTPPPAPPPPTMTTTTMTSGGLCRASAGSRAAPWLLGAVGLALFWSRRPRARRSPRRR